MCDPRLFGLALSLVVASVLHAGRAPEVSVRPLPPSISRAVDLRGVDGGGALVVATDAGVVRVELDDLSLRTIRPAGGSSGLFVPSRLGVDADFVVAAAALFRLDGFRTETEKWSLSLESIEDVDLRGQRLAVLGLRRDERGRVAPDGAWLWSGEIAAGMAPPTLKPVARTRPGAPSVGLCTVFGLGGVRYLEGGSLLVAWGGDPLVRLFDSNLRQRAQWDMKELGVWVDCEGLPQAQAERLSADPVAKAAWLGARAIIDEVLPVGPFGTLVIREADDTKETRWSFLRLLPEGRFERHAAPFVGPPRSHVRGDARAGEVLLVRFEDDPTTRNHERSHLIRWRYPAAWDATAP